MSEHRTSHALAGNLGEKNVETPAGKVAREPVQITLIDESDTFTVRPRLHEFATRQRVFRRPFLEILRKTQVQFLHGRVISLDHSQHRITVQDQQQHELEYDYLIMRWGV